MPVAVKRVYEPVAPSDGTRVLVDRLWPRGLKKEEAAIKLWLRDLAPSKDLCAWLRANPGGWTLFRRRYLKELASAKASAAVEKLHALAEAKPRITLLHGRRDDSQNNAIVLKELLEGKRKPPSTVGRSALGRGRIRKAKRQ